MKGPDPILEGKPKGFPDGFNMGYKIKTRNDAEVFALRT